MMNRHYPHDGGGYDSRHRLSRQAPLDLTRSSPNQNTMAKTSRSWDTSHYNVYNDESVSQVSPPPTNYKYHLQPPCASNSQDHSSLHGRYVRSTLTPSWSTASYNSSRHCNKQVRVVVDLTRVKDPSSSRASSSSNASSYLSSQDHMSHYYHHPQTQECMALIASRNPMTQPIHRVEREFVPQQYLQEEDKHYSHRVILPQEEPNYHFHHQNNPNHVLHVVQEENESLYTNRPNVSAQDYYYPNHHATETQQWEEYYHEDYSYHPQTRSVAEDEGFLCQGSEGLERPMLLDPSSLNHPNNGFWNDHDNEAPSMTSRVESYYRSREDIADVFHTSRYAVHDVPDDQDILSCGTIPRNKPNKLTHEEEEALRVAKLPPPLNLPIPPPPKTKAGYEVDCTEWSKHGGGGPADTVSVTSSTFSSVASDDSSFKASVISFAASIIDRREWMATLVHQLVRASDDNIKAIFSGIAAQHRNFTVKNKRDAKKTLSLIKEYRTSKRYCQHVLEHMDVDSILENVDIGLYDTTVDKFHMDVEKAIDKAMLVFQQLEEDGLQRQLESEAKAKKKKNRIVQFATTKVTKAMIQRKHHHLRHHVGNELKRYFAAELKVKWLDHQTNHLGPTAAKHLLVKQKR